MDLGQLVCTPRRPRCAACPIRRGCAARREGEPERYPVRPTRPETRDVHLAAAVARRGDGRVLLVRSRRGAHRVDGPLAGLWRFPSAEADRPETARSALAEELAVYGLELGPEPALGLARHAIMNRRISIRVYGAKPGRVSVRGAGRRWMSPGELERAAIPTLTRKISAAARLS